MPAALKTYQRKRNFNKTPEPSGRVAKSTSPKLSFVVQKHDASHLHFDFRLELGGVLVSWAVPKGPSMDPADKRLAVHVEDHPLEYASFEGSIPKGEYGGGTVMVWDRGTWTPKDADPAAALKRGRLNFELDGEKLKGAWTLTRMGSGRDNGRENWLLIKRSDEQARRGGGGITDDGDTSVASGRTLEEIAANGRVHRSNRKPVTKAKAKLSPAPADTTGEVEPAKATNARRAPMPAAVAPELCTLTDHVPPGANWVHEIKFDGYRLILHKHGDDVRLITRAGKDWTAKFPPIAEAVRALPLQTAIIDGEATILGPDGHSSFQMLQNAIKAQRFDTLVFFVFDLIYTDGYDLSRTPLLERKRLLRSVVPAAEQGVLRYSDHLAGSGAEVEETACRMQLEGIVCKRADSPYVSGRADDWLKIKCIQRQEFIIIGWTPPEGARKHFGALLLATHENGKLVYAGKVGTGFTAESLEELRGRLAMVSQKTCPADKPPTRAEAAGARWVSPEPVAEIKFTNWTDDGRLRHPSFQGLREDKKAADVRRETPIPVERLPMPAATQASIAPAAPSRRRSARGKADEPVVAGVRITHPDRVLYPEIGLTKLALAQYYESVADLMMPYLADRPLSTVRCPSGQGGQCFFQKHLAGTFPEPIREIEVQEKNGPAQYIAIDSVEGLVTLIQFGVLEIHPWGALSSNIEKPDLLTFDLDPGEGVAFEAVKEAAVLVRRELEILDLVPFLKLSGGKGLHVVVPIKPGADWDATKSFCEGFAKRLAREHPDQYVATMSKALRKGRVFIDYLRNSRGATSVAPYSTRARPGAPVSLPLAWRELSKIERPNQFGVAEVLKRIRKTGSPWAELEESRKPLPQLAPAESRRAAITAPVKPAKSGTPPRRRRRAARR